jgi:hypothetical protein
LLHLWRMESGNNRSKLMAKRIIFDKWYGGIRQSKYDQGGFASLKNCDIFTEVGTVRCNNSLANNNAGFTEPYLTALGQSGTMYFFSKTTGSIKKRVGSGVISSITSNSNTVHLGCKYFDDKIYYATNLKLGRFNDGTEASRSDSWQSLNNTSGGSLTKPMEIMNNILHIGNGKYMSTVNASSAYSQEAMVFPSKSQSAALCRYGFDILNFTHAGSVIVEAGVFRWDTSSSSWSSEDYINENQTNFVITSDDSDLVFICAGLHGNIYFYDGQKLQYFMNIPGAIPTMGYQQSTVFRRRPMFAIGGKVYSLFSPQKGLPPCLVHEYTCSAGENATIHSIVGYGEGMFLTWGSAGTYGLDSVFDVHGRATATIETPIFEGKIKAVHVYYEDLPTGTSIGIETKSDNGSWVSKTVKVDAINRRVYIDGGVGNQSTVQARITMNPSGLNTPVVNYIEFIQ